MHSVFRKMDLTLEQKIQHEFLTNRERFFEKRRCLYEGTVTVKSDLKCVHMAAKALLFSDALVLTRDISGNEF
jgi:hypothetical protein